MISTLHDPKNLSSRRRYFLTYSLVFLLLLPLVFFWHLLAGKTLISNGDGWNQHVKALAYFGWYLRGILRSAAGGHLPVIPDWDFCIGEGSDILNALHYYAMGDPLNLLSAAVPVRYTYILYSGLVLLRLYLAGAAFSALCFGLGHTDRRGILAGAVSYAFCSWAIANASRHPYFLNPLIYFPLLILGAERILQGKGTVPLTLAVAVAAASNFYFFYMLALLTALYVLLRLFFLFRGDRRGFFRCGLRIAGASLLGAMLAGVVLLPLLHIFLSDSRFGLERSVPLFYPLSYYLVLPATIVTTYGPNWLCIGVSPPVLLALFLLFLRRGRALLKTLVLIGLVFICFPWFGRALNGFAYVSNRWCWAFVLLCCYLLTSLWEELLNATPHEQFLLFLCTAAYTLLCFVCAQSRNALSFFALCLLLISLFSIRFCSVRAGRQLASSVLCVLVCVGAVSLGFWKNAPGAGNYISETVDVQTAREGLLHDDPDALRVLAGESPVRYAGSSISANAGMLSRLSSADYSWSLSNPHVVAFRTGLGLNDGVAYFYQDYDGRTALLSLSAVDCYMKPNASGRPVPYGFDPIGVVNVRERETASALLSLQEELGGGELSPAQRDKIWAAASQLRTVYRNRFALPLAYGYRRSVSDPVWEEMSALQKQEAMLSAVHLSEPVDGLRVLEAAPSEHELPYETSFQSYEISWQDGAVVTTADNCSLTLSFEGLAGSETYVELRGLDFDSTSRYELYRGDRSVDPLELYSRTTWDLLDGATRLSLLREHAFREDSTTVTLGFSTPAGVYDSLLYRTQSDSFYGGVHDYLINLGYSDEPLHSITIRFPLRGVYRLDSLRVLCVPFDHYEQDVEALKALAPSVLRCGTDSLSGSVTAEEPQVLCIAVPYASGWRAWLDGAETRVLLANDRYLGLEIPAGAHSFELRYRTPMKREGAVLSLCALALLIGHAGFRAAGKRRRGTAPLP